MRRTVLLALFCIIPGYLHADDFPVNFGFLGGLHLSYMEGSEIKALEAGHMSINPLLTGNGGIRLGFTITKWLEVESGIHFTGNGFELLIGQDSDTRWNGNFPQSINYNYFFTRSVTFMEFPLLLRLQSPYTPRKKFMFFGFGGIRAGFVVNAHEKIVQETITSNFPSQGESSRRDDIDEVDLLQDRVITDSVGNQIHYTYDDFHRRGDVSLTLGIGMEKRFGSIGLYFVGSYVNGLHNFNRLSDRALREVASFNPDTSWSGDVVLHGDPGAFFRSALVSTGLNIYIAPPPRR